MYCENEARWTGRDCDKCDPLDLRCLFQKDRKEFVIAATFSCVGAFLIVLSVAHYVRHKKELDGRPKIDKERKLKI